MQSDPYAANRLMAARAMRKLRPDDKQDYDYIAPLSLRARTIDALVARWAKEKPAALDRHGPRLLIDEKGRVDKQAVRRMRAKRDDRPMYLAE